MPTKAYGVTCLQLAKADATAPAHPLNGPPGHGLGRAVTSARFYGRRYWVGLPNRAAGLMESLPSPEAGWTAADRDRFITTFKAVLDYAIPVRKAADQAAE